MIEAEHLQLKKDELMRTWQVNPKIMCYNHLLGEHRELHALAGTLLKGTSIQGYIDNNLVEVQSIIPRHESLVKEMMIRGYKHLSPMVQSQIVVEHLTDEQFNFKVDRESSFNDLYSRCQICAWRSYLFYNAGYDLLDAYYHDNFTVFKNQYNIWGLKVREKIQGQCEMCYWWDYQNYQYGPAEYEIDGNNKGYCMCNNRRLPTRWDHFCDINAFKLKEQIT
jgi:hypothetical protein